MEAMQAAAWTDDRMDDLAHRMDEGFNRVDADLRGLRVEMAGMRTESNSRFDALKARFDARFDALQHLLIQVAGGMIAAFLAGLLGLIATQL
jgi:hypothetical protein